MSAWGPCRDPELERRAARGACMCICMYVYIYIYIHICIYIYICRERDIYRERDTVSPSICYLIICLIHASLSAAPVSVAVLSAFVCFRLSMCFLLVDLIMFLYPLPLSASPPLSAGFRRANCNTVVHLSCLGCI